MVVRNRYKLLLTIMMSVLHIVMLAQSDNANITIESFNVCNVGHYTIDNGLTSSFVSSIEEDEKGMLWLGTNDGINVFDGYQFKNFISDKNDSTAMCGKDVSTLRCVGSKVYVALRDGGLIVFNQSNGQFKKISIDDSPSNMGEFVSAYGICPMGDYIYVSYSNNIIKIDQHTGEQTKIVLAARKQHTGAKIDKMRLEPMPDEQHIVLMLGKTAFAILDTQTDKIRHIKFTKGYLNDICPVNDSIIYMGTTSGLYTYNIFNGQLAHTDILQTKQVQSVIKDYGIGFWIAYDNNHLMKWIPSRKKVREVENVEFFLNSHSVVNNMLEDENQILWLATNNAGLIKLDMKHPKIKNISITGTDIPQNYITRDIFARRSHEVWAACGIHGVLKVDTKKGIAEHIPVPHRNVYSVYVRRNNDILFGTTLGPLLYKPESPDGVEPIIVTDSIIASLDGRCIINHITEDWLGNVWFATQVGLYKYNGVKTIRYPSASHGIENVNVVYSDLDGRVWAGTETGSFVMEVGDSTFVETETLNALSSTDNNSTTSFADNGETVLIGTISGVLVYDKQTRSITAAPFNNQLSNTMIYGVVSNINGDIWLSTNRGVGYVKSGTERLYMFNHHDGLNYVGNDCHQFARYKQYLYIGNATNLNFIQMNNVHFNDVRPTPFVSRVTYGQSGKETDAVLTNDTLYTVKYLMRASLKVDIASSDFTMPGRNEFMYRVNNDDWINLVGSNSILVSGPMPGTYRVEVRSTNSDKMWSDYNYVFYIDIVPPLWLSNSAILFYIIITLAGTWFLIDIRFRSINRRMKQMAGEARSRKIVEAQRNRLAKLHKDQEDSIKYAKRIQESLMPPLDGMGKLFSKIFVYYMPRDIVSGDFYSIYHRNDKTFIISADCTGHGVPGAFISIIGIDHLYNIIMRQKIDDAGTILTYLHRDIHSTLIKRTNKGQEFNEGMDMTLCVVHHKEKKINFAGAMNDLYIIRDNDILTYHGERHSIGTSGLIDDHADMTYSSQMIDCYDGDMFYMFSDGYVDQFGGPEYKKFKHRRFKQLLLYIHKLPANDQKSMLNRRLLEWKGANEQTDDISIIGFEPWA